MFGALAQLAELRGRPLVQTLAVKKCLPLLPSACLVSGTADPWFTHDDPRYRVPEPFDHFDPKHDPKYPPEMKAEWISQHG